MGRRSRRRVRAGQQQPKQARPRPNGARVGSERSASHWIERRFVAALERFDGGDGAGATEDLAALANWWANGCGPSPSGSLSLVPILVCSYLCGELEELWGRGWQPADVPRVVGRHLSPRHARLVTDAIAEESETYRARRRVLPSWIEQLDEIGADLRWGPDTDHLARFAREQGLDRTELLRVALELLVMLHHLPGVPRLCPPPAEWDRSAALDAALAWRRTGQPQEVRYLERVRVLLAKAESTEFEEEAEAFTAKAQDLMTRHSLDAALLAAHAAGRRAKERPTGRRIGVDDPYASAKAFLLAEIADAATCRVVWSKDFGFSTVFGFEGELGSVELLYTSLLVQARTTMVRTGELGQRAKSRRFPHSFLVGFATRVGQRLRETASAAVRDATVDHGSGLLPVLADRARAVDQLRDETFPGHEQRCLSANDQSGWAIGAAAAELADISRGPLIEEQATA